MDKQIGFHVSIIFLKPCQAQSSTFPTLASIIFYLHPIIHEKSQLNTLLPIFMSFISFSHLETVSRLAPVRHSPCFDPLGKPLPCAETHTGSRNMKKALCRVAKLGVPSLPLSTALSDLLGECCSVEGLARSERSLHCKGLRKWFKVCEKWKKFRVLSLLLRYGCIKMPGVQSFNISISAVLIRHYAGPGKGLALPLSQSQTHF